MNIVIRAFHSAGFFTIEAFCFTLAIFQLISSSNIFVAKNFKVFMVILSSFV